MKRVVCTGAGGFLGRRLVQALPEAGFSIVAVSSRNASSLSALCGCGENPEANRMEIINTNDRQGISEALLKSDILLNCGFPQFGSGFEMAEGLDFARWIFRTSERMGVGSVVNVSTQSVYDRFRTAPAKETDSPSPEGNYAMAKYAVELLLEETCSETPRTNVRLASLVGPGSDRRVPNKMVKAIVSGGGTFFESGNRLGLMDVRDAVDGLVTLCKRSLDGELRPVYNLSSRGSYTITEMADAVEGTVVDVLDEPVGRLTVESRYQEGPLLNTEVDPSLFESDFGWSARRSLRDTIREIVLDCAGSSTGG